MTLCQLQLRSFKQDIITIMNGVKIPYAIGIMTLKNTEGIRRGLTSVLSKIYLQGRGRTG